MTTAIRDIMTKNVFKVNPSNTLREAAQLMKTEDIGSIPVCEGDRVIGIITDRDIAIRAVAEVRDPGVTLVSEIMSKDIVGVRAESDIQEAERLMHDHQLRRLPVLDDQGNLVGYLSMAKVARTEAPENAGKVIQGVSQASKPDPLSASGRKKSRKTG